MNLTADLLVVLAVAGWAWAAGALVQRLPFFPLRELAVSGPLGNVTPTEVEQVARTAVIGNFFTVDLDEVRVAFERLPWVRRAEVRRRWPDGLDLWMEEHVAVARWQQGDDEPRLVNTHGEVFSAVSAQNLPTFAGGQGSAPQLLSRYREFETALAAIGRRPVTLALSGRQAWQVQLDDGLVVELGKDEAGHPLAERLGRFVAYYRPAAEALRIAGSGVADMRYPNGFALRASRRSPAA
jgi:cell division protein FtsQ